MKNKDFLHIQLLQSQQIKALLEFTKAGILDCSNVGIQVLSDGVYLDIGFKSEDEYPVNEAMADFKDRGYKVGQLERNPLTGHWYFSVKIG